MIGAPVGDVLVQRDTACVPVVQEGVPRIAVNNHNDILQVATARPIAVGP